MTGMEPFLIPMAIGAAGSVASSVINKPKDIKPPEPAAPVRMPDPFAERAAKREEFRLEGQKRRGRASTLLDADDGTYLSDSLGE